ncbi:MAG: serine acetyltransferase [Prevotellaceae bacterium]|nr:serine acetyltransferase [Prevotellaceae bacterium]
MISNYSDYKYFIRMDAKANGINSWIDYVIKLLYGNIGACVYRYLKTLRKYEYSSSKGGVLQYYYRIKLRKLGNKYGITIIPNTVGYGLFIPHIEGGVVLNCRKLGNNCTIGFGVLCGNKGGQDELPTIGDNVKLYTGCKVIGNVTIGDNAEIAPNAVVVKDVPANAIVAGVPAKIIRIKDND